MHIILRMAILLLVLLFACKPEHRFTSWDPVQSIKNMDSLKLNKKSLLEMKEESIIGCFDCRGEWKDGELEIKFTGNYPELYLSPSGLGLPESWKDFSMLIMDVRPEGKQPILVKTEYIGYKNILSQEFYIKNQKKILFNLSEIPLAGNNEKPYHPMLVRISFDSIHDNTGVLFRSINLKKLKRKNQGPVLDRYGQRRQKDWEGKIRKEEHLLEARKKEQVSIEENSVTFSTKRDIYGGIVTGKTYPGNGYFSLHRTVNDRYFFITPEGNPFWSLGVTCVRPRLKGTDGTLIQGREHLFEYIPERNGEFAEVWSDSAEMSYYYLNILRKYGSLESWIDMVFKRFESWGINTIGNWSNEQVLASSEIPFTYSFRTTRNPEYSLGSGLNDVFDPGWERYVDSVFRKATEYKNNPFLLGYFVDNEAGWGNTELLSKLSKESPGRTAWVNLLKKKYTPIEKLNRAWEASFTNWDEVRLMKATEGNEAFFADYTDFESLYAQKYFSTVRDILKKHDPNHLYLGCRFTRGLKPDHILKEAGRFCDMITVNVYSLVPIKEQMTSWYEKTGKPILIGEHHLPLLSERQLPPHYRAFTAEERNHYYREYVKTWAAMPFSLGCHWYQLVDQHGTGRPSNGENQIIGLVDITDQPHRHLVDAIRLASDSLYEWHGLSGSYMK